MTFTQIINDNLGYTSRRYYRSLLHTLDGVCVTCNCKILNGNYWSNSTGVEKEIDNSIDDDDIMIAHTFAGLPIVRAK